MRRKMDTEKVSLRAATAEDSGFAFKVKKAALGQYVRDIHGWDEDEQRRLHRRRFDPAATRIVMLHGRDIGLVAIRERADCIRLLQLFLLPEAQGEGIGSHVLTQVLREADRVHRPAVLRVLKSNPRAKAFFERHGFTLVGETETHYNMERVS
jgi:GNAT superfamily N-acetyltransferase